MSRASGLSRNHSKITTPKRHGQTQLIPAGFVAPDDKHSPMRDEVLFVLFSIEWMRSVRFDFGFLSTGLEDEHGAGEPADFDTPWIEAKMTLPKYTAEDLKKLPLRAIVALAARCARRVEHLALLPDHDPGALDCRATVRDALQFAEDFSRGLPTPAFESLILKLEEFRQAATGDFARQDALAAIHQAVSAAVTAGNALDIRSEPVAAHPLGPLPEPGPLASLANVTADLAALSAFTAAVDAAGAVDYSNAFLQYAVRDYQTILDLNLGKYPEAGQPIDPSPDGPLGSIRTASSV